MSDATLSPSKVVFLLLGFLFNLSSFAQPNCKLQWGPSKIVKNHNCSFTKKAIQAPSSFYVNNFKWQTESDLFTIQLSIKNVELLSGLKLSFYYRGEMKASYTLPLYSDPEYNILKDDTLTLLSIPKSNLKWEKSGFKEEATFDGFTVYLATKQVPNKELTFSIHKTYLTPRQTQGRISITFDDGYKSNYTAAQIMKPLKLTGTAYIIPNAIDQAGHLTVKQLKQMKSWGWSLSSHLTTPVTQIKNLEEVLKKTKEQVSKWGSPESAAHFALPLGKYNNESLKKLSKKFKSVRLAGGLSETLPVQDKLRLKTINVTSKMTPQEVFHWCQEAVLNKEWAILMFHYIDRPEKGDLNYSSAKYKELMQLLQSYSKNVQTVEQILKD